MVEEINTPTTVTLTNANPANMPIESAKMTASDLNVSAKGVTYTFEVMTVNELPNVS